MKGLRVEPDPDDPTVRYLGEQTWRGGRYQVVELKRAALVRHTILAFFGADRLLHRVVVTNFFRDGTTNTEEAFLSDIKPNVSIPARLFMMVPPANAILEDTAKLQVENAEAERRRRTSH